MDGEPVTLSEVPLGPGGRLHISWGLGNELFLCGLEGPSGARGSDHAPAVSTSVRW